MKVIGVIPARWASTRFEGKVLAEIKGKPLIQHVWERAQESKLLNDVIIACDEQKVLDAAKGFGANAVLTSKDHQSGSDRIIEVVKDTDVDIVVNLQGDEPLIKSPIIDGLVNVMLDDKQNSPMATVIKVIENEDEINNPNVVKVVVDSIGHAIYFSRSPIPYNRENEKVLYYKHLGIYSYRKDFLLKYNKLSISRLIC